MVRVESTGRATRYVPAEQVRYRPVELAKVRRPAREFVAAHPLGEDDTARRIRGREDDAPGASSAACARPG